MSSRAALRSSGHKVAVFLGTVFILVVILGSAMYLIEGEASGFTSIPESVYWAIVTVTTVGYGDFAPVTPLGKALAAVAMVMGYSIIVVPTGIVSAELVQAVREPSTRVCPECLSPGHENGARYCKDCGSPFTGLKTDPPAVGHRYVSTPMLAHDTLMAMGPADALEKFLTGEK